MSVSYSVHSEETYCGQRELSSVSVEVFKIKKVKIKKCWEMFLMKVVEFLAQKVFKNKVDGYLKNDIGTTDPGLGFRGLGYFL